MVKLTKLMMGLSIPAALVLMGNIERGLVGTWAYTCLFLICAYWTGVYAYIVWNEKEETKRQNRKAERAVEKMLDYEYKREYIRDTKAA